MHLKIRTCKKIQERLWQVAFFEALDIWGDPLKGPFNLPWKRSRRPQAWKLLLALESLHLTHTKCWAILSVLNVLIISLITPASFYTDNLARNNTCKTWIVKIFIWLQRKTSSWASGKNSREFLSDESLRPSHKLVTSGMLLHGKEYLSLRSDCPPYE